MTIFVISFLLIITSIVGILLYKNQKAHHLAEKAHELESISRFKVKQVSEWYRDEINDAATIAQSPLLLSHIKSASSNPTSENANHVREYLSGLKSEHGYAEVIIASLNGEVVYSASEDTMNSINLSDSLLRQIAGKKSISMSLYFAEDGDAHLDIMNLINDDSLDAGYVIVFRIDPESFLFPLLSFTPYTETSSRIFLFSRVSDSLGIIISQPNEGINYGKPYRIKNPGNLITSIHMVTGNVFAGKDQENTPILAFSEPIPFTPWILFSKIDQSELLSSFNRQAVLILLLSSMAFLAVLIAISFLFSKKQQNVYKELLHSQQEFRTTLYSIGDAVIITDDQGKITLMNKEAEELTGWKETDAESESIENVFTLFDESTRHKVENPARKILSSISSSVLEEDALLFSRDSREIPISNSAAPIKDEISQTMGVVLIFRDKTEERRAQTALQESENKFRQLFEGHSAIKILIDPETVKIVDANEAAARFYGYSIKELKGLDLNNINTLGIDNIRNEIEKVIEQRKIHFEFVHRKKDGTLCDVEVFSSKITIAGKLYLHSIIHDVTEKMKAKHQVRLLIQSIEQSPVGIVITNPEGYVEFANSRMAELTGYTKSEIIGKLSKVLHSNGADKKVQRRIWSIIRAGEIWKGEIEDRRKDGSAYWSRIAISPIFDDEELIKHYVMVYEDVSEQKKMLSELIQAKTKAEESDQLKTAFLANMSHEIRTPMNGILGFIDLLQEPGLTGDQFDEYIGIVKASGERLISTITDIIDISKIESGLSTLNESNVNVNQLLIDLYNFFRLEAENKNLQLTLNSLLPEKNRIFLIDSSKLESILINLIKNALKFTKSGEIKIGVSINNNMLEFAVSDTGIGIPHGRLNSIFERFVQAEVSIARDYEGSGLGLSIAKAFVEMMNGDINVESSVGKGSTFSFRIPVNKANQQNDGINADKRKGEIRSKMKILIAEDDAISYIYLRTMLSKYGIDIIHACNGNEAIELCIGNSDISLVLMDMKMPVLDGYQATAKILELKNNLPIVALTAFAFADDREKALACGCIDYLSKPVKKELLLEIIKKHSGLKSLA